MACVFRWGRPPVVPGKHAPASPEGESRVAQVVTRDLGFGFLGLGQPAPTTMFSIILVMRLFVTTFSSG